MKNSIIEINHLKNYKLNESDAIFICWASPEDRCLGSLLKLSSNYSAEKIFIITYSHKSTKREKNISIMKKKLDGRGIIEKILVDEDIPLPSFKLLCKRIMTLLYKKKEPIITLDITTAIKWHLLIFIKYLDSMDLLKSTRIIYTEPNDYSTNIFQPMSFGLKRIFPIPTFTGEYDFNKENLLILILGFEGNRAYSLYENIDPAKTILLIADPPYHKKWKGRAEFMNQKIINLVGEEKVKKIDARNPFKVALQLEEILKNKDYQNFNHFISPLGTKLQLLGLYIYLKTAPITTNLLYSVPMRHNEFFYSYGLGKTWEIKL